MRYSHLFRKIQIASNEEHNTTSLKRTLGLLDVLVYGIGASVGAGIYSLVGIGANLAGPGVTLSFFACGVACMFTALSYAEFAAKVPITGSVYSYAYASFGELPAWVIGWSLCLQYEITASVVARSWAEYLVSFLSSVIPGSKSFWDGFVKMPIPFLEPHTCSPLSIVIVALSTIILLCGVQESAKFNNIMTSFNVTVLSLSVLIPLLNDSLHTENLSPYLPNGLTGMTSGAAVLFFSYIGFDMVACLSEEVINPKVNMPLGIIGSLFCSMTIYVIVSFAVVAMAPIPFLGPDVPISNGMLANACCSMDEMAQYLSSPEVCLNPDCDPLNHPFLLPSSRFISGGAIFGLTTAVFTALMAQPRIVYKIASDGLLPPIFAKVSEHTQVPTTAILVNGLNISFLACFFNLEALANTICLLGLLIFTFVNAAIIILRLRSEKKKMNFNSVDIANMTEVSPLKVPSQEPLEEKHDYSIHMHTFIVTLGIIGTSFLQKQGLNTIFVYPCIILSLISSVFIIVKMKKLSKSQCESNTFQCPGVPYVPLLGIACNSYMVGSLPVYSWVLIILFILLGLTFYFSYGVHYSVLASSTELEDVSIEKSSVNTDEVTELTSPSYDAI